MLKKLTVMLLIMTLFIACGKGKGDSTKDADGITKKQFLNYIQKTLAYYQTEEYQNMAAAYKKEAEGVKKIMER